MVFMVDDLWNHSLFFCLYHSMDNISKNKFHYISVTLDRGPFTFFNDIFSNCRSYLSTIDNLCQRTSAELYIELFQDLSFEFDFVIPFLHRNISSMERVLTILSPYSAVGFDNNSTILHHYCCWALDYIASTSTG